VLLGSANSRGRAFPGHLAANIARRKAIAEELFPRTPYPGSLHDCWWEGLLPTVMQRPWPATIFREGDFSGRISVSGRTS
jgi:hypothetical protein